MNTKELTKLELRQVEQRIDKILSLMSSADGTSTNEDLERFESELDQHIARLEVARRAARIRELGLTLISSKPSAVSQF